MKRRFFALVGLLVLGLLFVGCPNDTTDNTNTPTLESFAGVWKHGNSESGNDTITITGNTFTKEWEKVGEEGYAGSKTGTFVFDAETITFTTNANEVWKTAYTLTNKYLELTTETPSSGWQNYGWHWFGRFNKQ